MSAPSIVLLPAKFFLPITTCREGSLGIESRKRQSKIGRECRKLFPPPQAIVDSLDQPTSGEVLCSDLQKCRM